MKPLLFTFLFAIAIQPSIYSQGVSPSLDQISDNRLMFDMSIMTQADYDFITNTLQMELIYETSIADIGIFRATRLPIILPDGQQLNSIIEINNTAREETGQGGGGTTERDNYDFRSLLTDPANSNATNNPITNYCRAYNYAVRAFKNRVRVGVFDTGVNNDFEVAYNPLKVIVNNTLVGDLKNDNEATDGHNHGTHVAHTIQSISESSIKNYIEYLDYKILDDEGRGYMADLIIAVDQATTYHGVNILNLSLSTLNTESNLFLERYFNVLQSKNILIITSAGNNATGITKNNVGMGFTPSNFLNVGSINCNNGISSFSNYGPLVDVYMAGEDINSYDQDGTPLEYSGTSQATAILTGVAAALASHQANFDAYAIRCAILASIGEDQGQTDFLQTVNGPLALAILQDGCGSVSTNSKDQNNEQSFTTNQAFSIYPNPASDNITITLSKGNFTIMLNDLMGRNIITKNVSSYSTKHIEELVFGNAAHPGFHNLLIVNNETHEIVTKKVIIAN